MTNPSIRIIALDIQLRHKPFPATKEGAEAGVRFASTSECTGLPFHTHFSARIMFWHWRTLTSETALSNPERVWDEASEISINNLSCSVGIIL